MTSFRFTVVVVALLFGARPITGQLTAGDAMILQQLVDALGALLRTTLRVVLFCFVFFFLRSIVNLAGRPRLWFEWLQLRVTNLPVMGEVLIDASR